MTKKETIREIKENYKRMEESMIQELFMTVNNHHLTAGTFKEKVWKELFENIIPKKFKIEQGAFLIDSEGNVSNETDLVIFDEQYTPYVLKNKNIQFIPIEAVMVVVQCKSNTFKSDELINWEKSIDNLEGADGGFAGSVMSGLIFNNKREIKPLKIICGTFNVTSEELDKFLSEESSSNMIICVHSEKSGETYSHGNRNRNRNIYRSKDNKLSIYNKNDDIIDIMKNMILDLENKISQNEKLQEGIKKIKTNIENYQIDAKEKKYNLLTLVFQLNQYIMLINNPVIFPHQAYVKMFSNE